MANRRDEQPRDVTTDHPTDDSRTALPPLIHRSSFADAGPGRSRLNRRSLFGVGVGGAAALTLGAAARQTYASQSAELRPVTLAWNATAICTAAAPVARENGIFEAAGLDVEFVNFGGSTEQLLEAIATGKADAGVGMALRWLKPLEQGFDVNVTAGIHGGCMRLLGSTDQGITTLESLRGTRIAISDQASPAKNFFSILLQKEGINPFTEVEWVQYPADVLPLAVDKGEAQALADGDPRTWLYLRDADGALTEVATNLSGEYAHRTCCIVGIRGSLIRDERDVAAALTRALLDAGEIVATQPEVAAAAFAKYGGEGSVEDLATILGDHTHGHQPTGDELKENIVLYAEELKLVDVFEPETDSVAFAESIYADVLS